MNQYTEEINRRRTFAIISHPDAGKTTLTEKFLLYGGAINLAGSVKGKATARHAVSDWMEIEKERGISVTSSVLQFEYGGYCINILDTPGHQDFSEDTYRTLMAADSAVMVIDASKGVEAQTRKLFKVCGMRGIPIFTFINKLDRDANDTFDLLDEIEKELGIATCPVNWPIGSGKGFKGVYDREEKAVYTYSDTEKGTKEGETQVVPVQEENCLRELIGDPAADKLLEEIEKGSDVVYAKYENKKHSLFRNFGSWVNEEMAHIMLGKPRELYVSSYFAAKRFVVEEMKKYTNAYPYVIGLVLRTTKSISNVTVCHREREIGTSGYTLGKLIGLWFNGFTAFSVKPLRLATALGVVCSAGGFLYGIYTVVKKLVNPNVPMGFSSLMAAVVFMGGMMMVMLGLVGEYVGRMYISMNSSPQFVIRETVNEEI
mgnify:CR=1 FL=1